MLYKLNMKGGYTMSTKDKKCKKCPYKKEHTGKICLDILCLTLMFISTTLDIVRFFYN